MRGALSEHDAHPNPNQATVTHSDHDAAIFAKEVGVRATGLGWLEARARRAALEADGCTEDEVLEGMVDGAIRRKEESKRNLCSRCWHDQAQRCICHHLGHLQTALPAKVLVLMHHKEYLKAGDDAKLLLAMLPADRTELYVFGRRGDLARLQAELRVDPAHTLILWPGNDALTVEEFVERLPRTSPWRSSRSSTDAAAAAGPGAGAAGAADAARRPELPVLRVVVIDGAYGHARTMFRHLKRRKVLAPHVALHPKTLSLYHRAQKSYAAKSAVGVLQGSDPDALRISTVEAVALLLEELGEPPRTTAAIVQALLVNNAALACEADPNRPRPPTASDLTPYPDRHRPLTDPNRPRGHRPGLGRTRCAAESGETPQAEPSMGQGGEMPLASSCTGQGAQAEGGLSGGCWVSIRHGPCGLIVQCRIPEHLLMA